jgi:hypothetical protein
MSMHKIPLTKLERKGLIAHGLDVGTPSQLSDCFRHGYRWNDSQLKELKSAWLELIGNTTEKDAFGNVTIAEIDYEEFTKLIENI